MMIFIALIYNIIKNCKSTTKIPYIQILKSQQSLQSLEGESLIVKIQHAIMIIFYQTWIQLELELELYHDSLTKEPLNPQSQNLTTLPLSSVKSCHVYHPFSFSPFLNRNNLSHLFHHSVSVPSFSSHAVNNPSRSPHVHCMSMSFS